MLQYILESIMYWLCKPTVIKQTFISPTIYAVIAIIEIVICLQEKYK